jgi:hypothetical protein
MIAALPLAAAVDKRTLLLGAGALVAGVGVLWFITQHGKATGQAVGKGATDLVTGLAIGVGQGFGLPDSSDARVVSEGRAALERGDYLEASKKLPASEFLGGIGSKIGIWTYEVTHPSEAGPPRDASAGSATFVNGPL